MISNLASSIQVFHFIHECRHWIIYIRKYFWSLIKSIFITVPSRLSKFKILFQFIFNISSLIKTPSWIIMYKTTILSFWLTFKHIFFSKEFYHIKAFKFYCFYFCCESVSKSLYSFTLNIIMSYIRHLGLLLFFKQNQFREENRAIAFINLLQNYY